MSFDKTILILIGIIVIIYLTTKKNDKFSIENTTEIISQVDGMKYRIHKQHTDHQLAADTLATINGKIIDILRMLRNNNKQNQAVELLLSRYNPDNLIENSPHDPDGDTAYSLDKGQTIALCLREVDSNDIHDMDILMFVALHEMAHVAVNVLDHPLEFWSTFKFLLEEAELANIYISSNYGLNPQYYCGLKVNYNPRYDDTIPSIHFHNN
jgi:hypothetical protein